MSDFDRWLTTEPREQDGDDYEIPSTPLVWLVEENPRVGTLSDFAKDHKRSTEYGYTLDGVWSVVFKKEDGYQLVKSEITSAISEYDADDLATVTLIFCGEIATYTLDGRA